VNGHRQAVQLQLRDIFVRLALQQIPDALVEPTHFLFVESVVQAEHRRAVPHLDETLARLAADTLGGRIGCYKLRVGGFQLLQPAHQPVIFGVGDFRPVEHVIQMLVVMQLFAQIFYLCFYFSGGHLL